MINNLQELALFGYTNIGRLIDKKNISLLLESLITLKQSEIEKDGIDTLKENNLLESCIYFLLSAPQAPPNGIFHHLIQFPCISDAFRHDIPMLFS